MYELKVVRERKEGYGTRRKFTNASDVSAAFKDRFDHTDREEFLVLLLDAKNKCLGFNVVSVGYLTASLVHPREVFKPVILATRPSFSCTTIRAGTPARP